MSYGENGPIGFSPTGKYSQSTSNGQTQTFYIQNGFAANIFKNMPVRLQRLNDPVTGDAGLYVAPHPGDNSVPVLGVVSGIYYLTPQGLTAAGKQYWASGTNVAQNTYAVAQVIIDPAATYTVQVVGATKAMAVNFSSIGQNYGFTYPAGGSTGNIQTGISSAMLNIPDQTASVNAALPFKVIGLDLNPENKWGIPYNNAIVTVNNSIFSTGTAGIA